MHPVGTICWGIIGCGDVTEVMSGPALQKVAGSALVAVMRRSAERSADYAVRHGVPRSYDDAQRLIEDPDVNAVYVATPPSTHLRYTEAAAAAGKPVYVEKPMARNHRECLQMIAACRAARDGRGVPLYVAYYRRCLRQFLRVKELLEDQAIGVPRFVAVTHYRRPHARELVRPTPHWHVIPEISGAGRFMDIAPHALDILDYLLGPIVEACGSAANQGAHYAAEDIVCGQWRHASGVMGTGVWCFTSFDWVDRVEIVGSKGTITFAVIAADPVRLWTNEGTWQYPEPAPMHVQQPLIETIVAELRDGVAWPDGRCPSTGETAARTNWVMDRILERWRRDAWRRGMAIPP